MNNELNITENSLWTFLVAIQDGFKQGYVLSDSNANFPQGFISLYTCNLVKPESMVEKFNMPTEYVAETDTVVAKDTAVIHQKIDGRKKVK